MRHRTTLIIVAGVLAVSLVSALVALTNGGSDDQAPARTRALVTTRATPTTRDTSVVCGAELPLDFAIPEGFEGPVRAKAGDAPPLELGQLALVWTAPDVSVEIRWPADAAVRGSWRELPPSPPTESLSTTYGPDIERTASGGAFYQMDIHKGDEPIGCQVLQLTVYGGDDIVRRTFQALTEELLVRDTRLITGSEDVPTMPSAVACRTPPGVESPNRGGAVVTAPQPSPQDALAEFGAADTRIPQDGYMQLGLADGTFAFGHRDPLGEQWVTVIHVASVSGGWAVDRWDASGC